MQRIAPLVAATNRFRFCTTGYTAIAKAISTEVRVTQRKAINP